MMFGDWSDEDVDWLPYRHAAAHTPPLWRGDWDREVGEMADVDTEAALAAALERAYGRSHSIRCVTACADDCPWKIATDDLIALTRAVRAAEVLRIAQGKWEYDRDGFRMIEVEVIDAMVSDADVEVRRLIKAQES